LLLAVKINDKKETKCAQLMQSMEKVLGVSSREICLHELEVFAALEFSLHIPREEYMPHFERILNYLDFYNVQEYIVGKSIISRHPKFI
jgi:hypothetical protein